MLIRALRGWKEGSDFIRAVDPALLADGIDETERCRICQEGTEARDAIDELLMCLGGI